jgi:hypothetical protein
LFPHPIFMALLSFSFLFAGDDVLAHTAMLAWEDAVQPNHLGAIDYFSAGAHDLFPVAPLLLCPMKQSRITHIPLLAAALLLGACHQPTPEDPLAQDRVAALAGRSPGAYLSPEHDGPLYYDLRYLDSTDTKPENSWSARTRREMAIAQQLRRLELANRPSNRAVAAPGQDSTWAQSGDGPLIGYPSEAAWRADIYRKIDSLKVLEHLPVTPH